MILNEKVFGVIEIASFKKFDQYKIDFIKKLGEIIASTISNVKNNMRTTTLLEQSKIQSEEMREQEEELRQNMEELQATQEEAARREHEMHETLNAINNSIAMVEIDMDGYVMDANPLFISLTSSTLLQIQNKSLASIVSKDFDIDELIAELNDGRSFTGYIPFNSNSSEVKLRVTFTPLKNEDEMYYKTIGILTREVE